MTSTKEKLNGTSLLVQPPSRKNSGTASATMRKYQQLALAIVSVISLMAFLFYKHEYDRLRYTLEYLEMFGSSPVDLSSNALCGGSVNKRLYTAPHLWMKLSSDIVVYSAFWDEGNGLTNPQIRTIALVKKSDKPHTELQSKVLFESDGSDVNAVCSLEEIKLRSHAKFSRSNDIKITILICDPENNVQKVPYLTQFRIGNEDWSSPILIQESEMWKSVTNITCACVFSAQYPASTLRIIEFISYHNILGVGKFVFFGPILTPLVRKLLDKYRDDDNIFYEEKAFNLPKDFILSDEEIKTLIERDCLYRHRGTYENVVVLKLNEFIVPRTLNSLQEVQSSVGGRSTAAVSEFHFVSQKVCLDESHSKDSDLLLGSQIRSLSINKETGVAILRPHLLTRPTGTGFNSRIAGISYAQHVPSAVANIYSFETCRDDKTHIETDHLPTNARFVELVSKSLLYRKWKVNL